MNIIIMCRTVSPHSLEGYDAACMCRAVSEKHRCRVYSEETDGAKLPFIDREALKQALYERDAAVIYCHDGYWEDGPRLLKGFAGRLVIRYRGIAPESLYDGFDPEAYYRSLLGRNQTKELQKCFPKAYWLCASHAVSEDLDAPGRVGIGFCQPFLSVDERYRGVMPEEATLRMLIETTSMNLLYAGPISPEYGILAMLDVLVAYRDLYDGNVVLHLMRGGEGADAAYVDFVCRRIEEYGLMGNVRFVPKTRPGEEVAHYLACDAMLFCAEYDGFCRAAAEAQYFRLPVLALNKSSAPELMGLNQLCFDDDPRQFAAALQVLRKDGTHGRTLGRIGRKNYEERLTCQRTCETFTMELEKGLSEL